MRSMGKRKRAIEVGKAILIVVVMFIAYGLADHIQYSAPWSY